MFNRVKFSALALLSLGLLTGTASAREPGVLPTIPPGASMGVPIAAPTPYDGVFFSTRTGLSYQHLYDANGNELPTEITIRDTAMQFAIIPGFALLGGQYRAFLTVPMA